MPDLTCRELVMLITDYLEGALPPPDTSRFEGHISGCEGCGTYLEQIRITVRVTGRLSEESIEPHVKTRLLEAFRNWKSR